MNIKQFTKSAIMEYIDNGGVVHPDITLDIFLLIEKNECLLKDYYSLFHQYKSVNPTIGKTICHHFNLIAGPKIPTSRCKLIKEYTRLYNK